jgi:CheY-like chemotaxis protein
MPTVLVVDDESSVRELASRMLREAGYVVVEARSGSEAWVRFQRAPREVDALTHGNLTASGYLWFWDLGNPPSVLAWHGYTWTEGGF